MRLLAAAVLLGLGCWNPALAADEDIGDAVVTASIAEPSTLVPLVAADSASHSICALLFNGLVKYDKTLRLIGDLAERWDLLDGGLTLRFHLRRGVRWHDGAPLTADDVRFTYESLINPAVRTPYRGDFERVRSLTVVDPWTVEVRYAEPFAPALSSWTMWIVPRHRLAGQAPPATPFARRPVGTGPYRLRRWRTAEWLELEANSDYFGGAPAIRGWVERIIPDQATTFLELQTEGIDVTSLTPLQYRRQATTPFFTAQYQLARYPSFGYTYLGYNLSLPMFQDLRVRQAIALALDKPAIVRGALLGLGRVATGPFLPDSWAHDPGVPPTPHDPARAKALLAEAGWQDTDGDGWLDRGGRPFAFTILTNQNLSRELTAQIIQQQLKDVGIRVQVRVVEWSSFLAQFIQPRRYEAVLLAWGLSPEPDLYDIWHSSKTKPGEFNFIGYANPVVDRLLEEGRGTFDQGARAERYHAIHRILAEDQPVCFLYVGDALPIIHRRIRNVEVTAAGFQHNLTEWYVPRREHRYQF